MKTVRSALLAAAILAGAPSTALAQPDAGDRGGRPSGPGRFERGGDTRPSGQSDQPRPQGQPSEQRQDFGGRRDFGGGPDAQGRPDRPQAPAPARFDGQRPEGPGRFALPDGQRNGFDRRPDTGNRPFDNPQVNNRRFDDRGQNRGRGFDNNARSRGNDRFDGGARFDDRGQFDRGDRDDRRFDNNRFDNNGFGNNRFQPNWRNDRRYDWRGYRDGNRQLFRAPRYAPPRGYGFGYRPFARGYQLQPFFYGQNYWINDPWRYRLPPAYGSYRWVRYYNDVLLVDIYDGNVIDVIQNFFW